MKLIRGIENLEKLDDDKLDKIKLELEKWKV
jgi:hypothetical protein